MKKNDVKYIATSTKYGTGTPNLLVTTNNQKTHIKLDHNHAQAHYVSIDGTLQRQYREYAINPDEYSTTTNDSKWSDVTHKSYSNSILLNEKAKLTGCISFFKAMQQDNPNHPPYVNTKITASIAEDEALLNVLEELIIDVKGKEEQIIAATQEELANQEKKGLCCTIS